MKAAGRSLFLLQGGMTRGLLALIAAALLGNGFGYQTQRTPEAHRLESADLSAIREVVTRHVIETLEPPCQNVWDSTTYCLEFEDGEQPTAESWAA